MPRSKWSLWSTNSVLSIGSYDSALSIASVGSFASIGSIGSALSIGSTGSVLSMGSALSARSRWSLMSYRSFGAVGAAGKDRAGSPLGPRRSSPRSQSWPGRAIAGSAPATCERRSAGGSGPRARCE